MNIKTVICSILFLLLQYTDRIQQVEYYVRGLYKTINKWLNYLQVS